MIRATAGWSAADVGDQAGRVAVVTGSTSGIGLEVARVLAAHGATVVLGARDAGRGEAAAASVRAGAPGSDPTAVSVVDLDLASLGSVRAAAAAVVACHPRVDLLVNAAGVMRPRPDPTVDGFEPQVGVNHLGHFALTGLLLDHLAAVPGSRVVTVTSGLARWARLDGDDPARPGGRRSVRGYASSKLANVVFTLELQRRLVLAGAATVAVAAHPGLTRTGLARTMPLPLRGPWGLARPLSQAAAAGALVVLRAAVDPSVSGGELLGPSGPFELRGPPTWVQPPAAALDVELQHRLWDASERLTGVRWPARDRPAPG